MKKFLNKAENFVDEMIDGIIAAHPRQLKYINNDRRCIVNVRNKPAKVALASGGGSGHLPLFIGFVGDGLLDGCSVGGVFQSPSAEQMLEVTKHIDQGAGVLYIYGNYGGDIMNFDMAAEMAEMDDITVKQVVVGEDVASSKKGEEHKRRGVAGMFFAFKTAAGCAETGADLEEVHRIAQKTCANMRSMGVALSPCIVPEVGKPSFTLGDDEMEIGMGVHGEPGIGRSSIQPADEVVDQIMAALIQDLPYQKGDEVAVLVNGLGATPKEELYIMYRRIAEILEKQGISVFHVYVGEFATSMEMAGASISMLKLDAELKKYLSMPASTAFFEQGALR